MNGRMTAPPAGVGETRRTPVNDLARVDANLGRQTKEAAVPDVLPVDRLEVLVVVDNATDSLSTNPKNVISEWSGLLTDTIGDLTITAFNQE